MVRSVMRLHQDRPYHHVHYESCALVQIPQNGEFRVKEILRHKTIAQYRAAVLVSLAKLWTPLLVLVLVLLLVLRLSTQLPQTALLLLALLPLLARQNLNLQALQDCCLMLLALMMLLALLAVSW